MAITTNTQGDFIINNITFHAQSLKVSYESLADESSGRASSGKMIINWVYSKIRKVEIEMPPMTASEVSQLLSLVQGKTYSMSYWDPLANQVKTSIFYTSTSAADLYSGVVRNGLWQGVAFNAIEVEGER